VYQNNATTINQNHYLRVKPVIDESNESYLGTKIWLETENGIQYNEITSIRGMYSASEHIAHFGLGDLNRVDLLRVVWPDGNVSVEKNVKVDQEIEIYYSKSRPEKNERVNPKATIFENVTEELGIEYRHEENVFDDFSRQFLLPYKMSELGPCIAKGDLNSDGLDDFFIGGAAGRSGQLFIQNADGTFTTHESETLFADKIHEDMGAAFFDADNDGDQDLYVVSGGNEFRPRASFYQDRLYLNDGSGNLLKTEDWLPKINISGSKVYPEDIDGDGDMDLFLAGRHIPWSYPDPESSVILINEGNKFENKTSEIAPELTGIGLVNDAVWVDFNQDGQKDLVLAGEWMPVTFFQNINGSFQDVTEELGLDQKKGWWFSIASADMDKDGDMDLIVGNFGLNSKYRGTEEEPFEVFYHDMDNNGRKDIVLAYSEEGRKYPYRRRGDAIVQVPGISEKFKDYDTYAASDVYEIYGHENLDRALHYQANTFASMYIENKGNDQFEYHPLPYMAQLSSVNDILVNDYNQDGHQDILIAGNMYCIEVRTPRNDASIGLLLTGDGKGHFTAMTNQESGFFVPYDVKSMVEIRYDDTRGIVIGCNNDLLRIFKVKK
jgi:hypothetical protein